MYSMWQSVGVIDSKRKALQLIAKVFDPCGLFSPTLVQAKANIQQMWKDKRTWDEKLLDEVSSEWAAIEEDIKRIPMFQIGRQIGEDITVLVCFTDASFVGYAACVYSISPSKGPRPRIIFRQNFLELTL